MMLAASDPTVATVWARVGYLGIPLIPPAIYTFTVQVLRLARRRRVRVTLVWAAGLVFVFLFVATNRVMVGLYDYSWGFYPRYGAAAIPYLVYFVGVLACSLWEFIARLRGASPGRERARLQALVLAFAISYFAMLDYLPALGIPLPPVGYVPILLFLGICAWTIRRYRLLDLTPSFAAEQILATMADPLIVLDPDGCIRIANEAVEAVLSLEGADLIGSPVEALAPGDPATGALLRDLLEHPSVHDRELLLGAGRGVEVSLAASPLHDAAGAVVGVVVIARDIRERKRADAELRQREERFRALIENVSDAVVVLGANGDVRYAAPTLQRVTGYAPEERVGENSLQLIHPDDQPRALEALVECVAHPGSTSRMNVRVQHRDSTWRSMEATATNLLHHPAIEGIIVAYHDVTARIEAEEALRRSEEQLRHAQKMEAVGRLAGGVAHDFNNLLTAITGQARLLLDFEPTSEELRIGLEEIVRAGTRAGGLTRQLLAFSRKQVLQPRVLDLNAVLLDTERMLRRLIGEDVALVVAVDADLGNVRADPGQMEQVIVNLAVNARDAMPEGGTLTIGTRAAEVDEEMAMGLDVAAGRYVVLTVRDTGTGIDPRVLPHIFEPFFTTKEVGTGTGLGLATVYGIVRQSGGAVSVASPFEEGTVFEIYLPCTEEALDPTPAPTHVEEPKGVETILLVEDDDGVRSLARQVLRRSGYRVLEADNGRTALGIWATHGKLVDLLLTDIIMPEMGGRELAARIGEERPDLRVLFMSGYSAEAISSRGVLDAGVSLLEKPFTPAEFVKRVRDALDAIDAPRAGALTTRVAETPESPPS